MEVLKGRGVRFGLQWKEWYFFFEKMEGMVLVGLVAC
jgi:hypothetical protein